MDTDLSLEIYLDGSCLIDGEGTSACYTCPCLTSAPFSRRPRNEDRAGLLWGERRALTLRHLLALVWGRGWCLQAARRASIAQGAGLLRAVQTMFPLDEQRGDMIRRFRGMVRGGPAFPGETYPARGARLGQNASNLRAVTCRFVMPRRRCPWEG